MGIRFKCHQCGHELHVKDFQAGKRSKCPDCSVRFRIPAQSADYSIAIDNDSPIDETATTATQSLATATKAAAASVDLDDSQTASSTSARNVTPGSPTKTNDSVSQESTLAPPLSPTKPKALQDAPEANWYVQPPTGGQYGPASSDVFGEWLAEHRVTRDSLVWREGWEEWQSAGEVFSESFGPPPTNSIPNAKVSLPRGGSESAVTAPLSPATANSTALTLDRTRLAKKIKRKRNYLVMISVLAVISIGLIIALIVVLSM